MISVVLLVSSQAQSFCEFTSSKVEQAAFKTKRKRCHWLIFSGDTIKKIMPSSTRTKNLLLLIRNF